MDEFVVNEIYSEVLVLEVQDPLIERLDFGFISLAVQDEKVIYALNDLATVLFETESLLVSPEKGLALAIFIAQHGRHLSGMFGA